MLTDRLRKKVEEKIGKFQEIETFLGSSSAFNDPAEYKEKAQEHAYLGKIKELFEAVVGKERAIADNEQLLKSETDPELLKLIEEDVKALKEALERLSGELELVLVPPDPRDNRGVIMEIRAGTGGDEAALFVGDCVRMYKCFADKKGWKYEPLSAAISERGGFKEYVMAISGPQVFRLLQYEAGTHRVQRVPETETQGRVHTSAVTIAILPEPTAEEQVQIDEKDLRIDTFRSTGAGGQHVNTTDSAVRITHIPTGAVATCQEERSQHKNRDKAMRLLVAQIADAKRKKEEQEMSSLRASQVGSGDRSERIRTYNFSQNRVTDHRINVTLYSLNEVLNGKLDALVEALVAYFYQQKLVDDADGR